MTAPKPKNIQKILIAISCICLLFYAYPVRADQFDEQIKVASQQAAAARVEASQYSAQAKDYQTKVNQLQAQISSLEAEMRLTQLKLDQLEASIADNKKKLEDNRATLSATLKQIYLDGNQSTIEILFASQSLSDYFARQEYLDKIKQKIQDTIDSIQDLQKELGKQKDQVTSSLTEQKQQRQQIATTQSEQAGLLALASQNKDAANAKVQSANAQISSLRAAQAAMYARINWTSSTGGYIGAFQYRNLRFGSNCERGYPAYWCTQEIDAVTDSWGMYNRECVSYAAFRVHNSGRYMPYWGGIGNAYEWIYNARRAGIANDNSPRRGDVLIAPATMVGGVGHAMYVEDDDVGDGWVRVSQYNWGATPGIYSEMDVRVVPGLVFIHF